MANGGDTKPADDKPAARPEAHPETVDAAKAAEKTATKLLDDAQPSIGDKSTVAKPINGSKPDAAVAGLPDLKLVGQIETSVPVPQTDTRVKPGDAQVKATDVPVPAARQLDDATIQTHAKALRDALGETSMLIFSNPNQAKVEQILGPLGRADRIALENAFNHPADGSTPAKDLRTQMREAFGPIEGVRMETVLQREDGRSNDAGAVRVALATAESDPAKASAQIEQIFRQLNSQQIAQLRLDYTNQTGHDLTSDIKVNQHLSPALRDSFDKLAKGSDLRTPQDVVDIARTALQQKDRDLLTNILAGDAPSAVAARQQLNADQDFRKELARAFPNPDESSRANRLSIASGNFDKATDPATLDYLKNGHVGLDTIARQDTAPIFFNNKENLELALRNATDIERAKYRSGKDIEDAHREPTTPQEREALQFYRGLHESLAKGGNARENAVWEDQLLNGRRTIASEMAATHSDGWTPLGLGSGHKTNDLMGKAENLSRQDWEALRDPVNGQRFRTQIESSLATYATPEESRRIMSMLDQKAQAATFEDASKISRSLDDTISDNRSSTFLGMGTSYDALPIMNKLAHLSPAEATKYHDDAQYRKQIDDMITDNFLPGYQVYARTMLEQVARTGQPAQEGVAERILANGLRREPSEQRISDVETLLADKAVRDRLNQPDDKLSPADRSLKMAIENAVLSSISEKMPTAGFQAQSMLTDSQMRELMTTGHLSPSRKLQWGYDRENLYAQVASASPVEREASNRYLSDGEKQLVDAIAKQNGQMQLEDRMRSFVLREGTDYQAFQQELRALSPEQKQSLKDAYEAKYHSPLNQDFLQRVGAQDQTVYRQYLNPSENDGRQDSYDNYRAFLDARTGTAADGTELTAERASELQTSALENYQRQYAKLNPQQQEAMNQFFGQALKDNQHSKEKLAEILVDASITAAALTAAPFTAGLSTAALLTVIGTASVAGAGYRVAVFRGIQGDDFDGSMRNVTKQALIGGTTAALSLVGPELFAMSGRFTSTAATAMAGDLAAASVALRPGAQALLRTELSALTSRRGFVALTEAEAAALTEKVAAQGITETQRVALQKAITESSTTRLAEAADGLSTSIAARSTLGRQAADNALVGAGGNAASEIIVAPLNEHGVDWERLGQSALTGGAVGAVMPVAFRAVLAASREAGVVASRFGRDEAGMFIDPSKIDETISFRNSRTGEVATIRPGEGEKFRLTNEWQYESGGRFTPDVTPIKPAVANAERMTAAELREVSTTISANLGDRSVTPQQFRDIFEGEYVINGVKRTLTAEERKMAGEIMEQTLPNMNSRSIDERMVSLRDQLAADPNWSWQKRTDPFGRPYDGVNVLVLDGTTDGNALSHLFNKNSGVVPTVKVLQGAQLERMQMGIDEIEKLQRVNATMTQKYGDNLDHIINPRENLTVRQLLERNNEGIASIREKHDLDQAIVFDDIRNATDAQKRVLAGMQRLAVADLNGFNRGPNIYDYASLGFGAGADAMRGRIGTIVEQAETIQRNSGVTRQEAVRQAIDANYAQTTREALPNARLVETTPARTNREARDATAANESNPEAFREQSLYQELSKPLATPEQIQNFLGRLSADQQRLGARILQDGLVVNNYGTMVDQARTLHQRILATVPGHDPKKMLIVTGLEENGSAYLTNSIYARANGLTADNFVSVTDLRTLAAKKPGEKLTEHQQHLKEILGDRRLVYLDDYAYSGRQMPSLINNLQKETLARLRGADGQPLVPEITVGTLGRYEVPENTWNNAANYPHINPEGNQPFLQVNVAESPSLYRQLYDSQFFRNSLSQEERDRVTLWLGAQSLYSHSTINTTMILPYGGPNNNIPWIQAFIESRNGLGLPARYRNADWSELEAGTAEFDRNRVLGEIVKPPAKKP